MINVELPLILVSPNKSEHHYATHTRNKKNAKKLLCIKPKAITLSLPCTVTITRYAPKLYDHDNYVSSCKFIRDEIASYLRPGLARGRADDDETLIKWEYKQEKSKQKKVRIQIT